MEGQKVKGWRIAARHNSHEVQIIYSGHILTPLAAKLNRTALFNSSVGLFEAHSLGLNATDLSPLPCMLSASRLLNCIDAVTTFSFKEIDVYLYAIKKVYIRIFFSQCKTNFSQELSYE